VNLDVGRTDSALAITFHVRKRLSISQGQPANITPTSCAPSITQILHLGFVNPLCLPGVRPGCILLARDCLQPEPITSRRLAPMPTIPRPPFSTPPNLPILPLRYIAMTPLDYNWWVPQLDSRPTRPAILRAFTDLTYVSPWLYSVIPGFMLVAMVFSPDLRTGTGLEAVLLTSGAWILATRARFAMAVNVSRRRSQRAPATFPRDDYSAAA
jgi:hypothetical protein